MASRGDAFRVHLDKDIEDHVALSLLQKAGLPAVRAFVDDMFEEDSSVDLVVEMSESWVRDAEGRMRKAFEGAGYTAHYIDLIA